MISKIGKSNNLENALDYNILKVNLNQAYILLSDYVSIPLDSNAGLRRAIQKSFEPFLLSNYRSETTVRHISLNPNPKDKLDDLTLRSIAKDYMEIMGYENQPYIVFKHFDIERIHLHIVTTPLTLKVANNQRDFEFFRSMEACEDITRKYGLTPWLKKEKIKKDLSLAVVDYRKPDLIGQIDSVLKTLPYHYSFKDIESFNALLSLFKIKCIVSVSKKTGKKQVGYLALNLQNNAASNFIVHHRLSSKCDFDFLTMCFKESIKRIDKQSEVEEDLKKKILMCLKDALDYNGFKTSLKGSGINIVRQKDSALEHSYYFISHKYKHVYSCKEIDQRLVNKLDQIGFNTLDYDKEKRQEYLDSHSSKIYNQMKDSYNDLKIHPYFSFLDDYTTEYNKGVFVSFFNAFMNKATMQDNTLELEEDYRRKKKKKSKGVKV
ncbi:relaxase/mobilization nuclease domain-containing protein [Myroides pelagicus]|uniref:Relaxase/mobilization nuclease domain-containing protein n=1 Tax=Myroides pelagicus TaxID=270914 RepID=A0A7K1GPA1_9FLAO|nr:relaxase/mobilization nuclease domain-containing protein [Myroides pelagicus]MTH30389.1 relaxase/mobilization nuclease domain-containing protein [Myroides pelagicus]